MRGGERGSCERIHVCMIFLISTLASKQTYMCVKEKGDRNSISTYYITLFNPIIMIVI